jgi:bisanhydrobacterioruberin hydratase
MMELVLRYRAHLALFVLVVLYGVGIGGILSSSRDWFLQLTPLTLMISLGLLLLNHVRWSVDFVATLVFCLLVGFWIEVLGVHTGVVFGSYSYGATLGWSWLEVPLIISCNWLILVYCSGVLVVKLSAPVWVKALLAAGVMTILDVLIEPVAMHFDFWDWEGGSPPIRNYCAWFVVSFVLSLRFQKHRFDRVNLVGLVLLGLQFVFFGILNVLILWE